MPQRLQLLRLLDRSLEAPAEDRSELHRLLESAEPADAAFCFEEFDPDEAVRVFNEVEHEQAAQILREMTDEYARGLIAAMSLSRLQKIVDVLPPDDATDVYNLLPEAHRIGILQSIDTEQASEIRKLAGYEERTAGAIMTTQFVSVGEDATADTVLDDVRKAEKVETDQVYVVGSAGRLVGSFSLQDLLHETDPDRPIHEVMDDGVISVHEDEDQEEVARIASTYGQSTVPVVDDTQQLVGIVTADDLDSVQEEEASEDIFRLAGTISRHPTKLPVRRRIRNRLPTIVATVLIGLVTAQILGVLGGDGAPGESTFIGAMRYVLIVIAVAGNVGTIANAIVVRGLATSELERGHIAQPFVGELLVGIGIGIACAGMTFLGIGAIEGQWLPLGPVVALSLFFAVVFSAAAGFLIPLFCDQVGVDPALAGPLVIALNDLAGTAVYVAICIKLIPLFA